ncbi:response regulator transcription factor [Clostridium septicum]|uniref:Stage 0 sporulation protein A homolog n=1 Tax=Clostridium septicum TaxID=1504 RepID=A0A9N7JLQ7_CLOSE|nr:response regulator transcription factor [Clostridium septicum]AYE34265.1 DNA-binding response regulator [Clostridium septicum]MDU1313297.1 response regulator transcription factor [Clostridium septicum]QAS59671.1 response regulator transcription factor [Clostridium septicum]UEC22239.1 response regulator transcription factor [Clostridium septicum]USS02539.1 response regulator transcription factor [Clostridium septicum]
MAKILVVDDEEKLRGVIKKYAEFDGYEVIEAADGMEAVLRCEKEDFDIIIMDVMMPELDGFSAVKEIRKSSDVPVIMLSARGEEYDKLHGFDLGIDDYVVKPFSSKEIMRRVSAILRRVGTNVQKINHDLFKKDGLVVDITAHKVTIDGEDIDMSPKVYELLFYMIRNKNIALSRERLITEVWGYDYFGDDRTLDTHIKLLRQALGKYSKLVVTLRNIGYRFEG